VSDAEALRAEFLRRRTEIRGVLNRFGLADMGAEDALAELFTGFSTEMKEGSL
jgi:hypothetical protein